MMLLRDNSPYISFPMIRELHLLVSISSYVVSEAPSTELVCTINLDFFPLLITWQTSISSGFGGLHTAILSLAAKCMVVGRFNQQVIPISETEAIEAQTPTPGSCSVNAIIPVTVPTLIGLHPGLGQSENLFQAKLEESVKGLRKWIFVYLTSASGCTGALPCLFFVS